MSLPSVWSQAFKLTLPVFFGFFPLGIAFGILFNDLGYHWFYTFLMSLLVYAGSAQFLVVGMLALKAGLLEIGLMTLVLNSRQTFYGISLLHRYAVKGWRKAYLVWVLTDETYSIITALPPGQPQATRLYVAISACNHFYWVLSCVVGAFLSQAFTFNAKGMEFTLTALFLVMALDQYKRLKVTFPFLIALGAGASCFFVFGKNYMLLTSLMVILPTLLLNGKKHQWA